MIVVRRSPTSGGVNISTNLNVCASKSHKSVELLPASEPRLGNTLERVGEVVYLSCGGENSSVRDPEAPPRVFGDPEHAAIKLGHPNQDSPVGAEQGPRCEGRRVSRDVQRPVPGNEPSAMRRLQSNREPESLQLCCPRRPAASQPTEAGLNTRPARCGKKSNRNR